MKTIKLFSTILALSLLIFSTSGCKKDSSTDPENLPVELVEESLPAIMMTLSAISYASDTLEVPKIKSHIKELLTNTELATQGSWSLAWGPGVSSGGANMAFVAKTNNLLSPVYAIVIRGTVLTNGPDVTQDTSVFVLKPFLPNGEAGDSVATGAMEGLIALLAVKDDSTGNTLEEFLSSITVSDASKATLFVTGHSQGGYLAPLMAYWVMKSKNDKIADKFKVRTLTFAAPSVGNKPFTQNFTDAMTKNGGSIKMYVNTKDVMPYFWHDLIGLDHNKIPMALPLPFAIKLGMWLEKINSAGIQYDKLTDATGIGFIQIKDTTGYSTSSIHVQDSLYKHWVGVQHSHNNYLSLLGAHELSF